MTRKSAALQAERFTVSLPGILNVFANQRYIQLGLSTRSDYIQMLIREDLLRSKSHGAHQLELIPVN